MWRDLVDSGMDYKEAMKKVKEEFSKEGQYEKVGIHFSPFK